MVAVVMIIGERHSTLDPHQRFGRYLGYAELQKREAKARLKIYRKDDRLLNLAVDLELR